MSAFAYPTASAATFAGGVGADDFVVAMDDSQPLPPLTSRYAQLASSSASSAAAASLVGLAHTAPATALAPLTSTSLAGPSAIAGETFHDAADALLFPGATATGAYDPIANDSFLGVTKFDPLSALALAAPAQQPAAARVKVEPLNFNALNYNYAPTATATPVAPVVASPHYLGGTVDAAAGLTPQQQLQLLQQQLLSVTPASVYASGALSAYGLSGPYAGVGATAPMPPTLSVEYLLSPPPPQSAAAAAAAAAAALEQQPELMTESSPDSVVASMSPASPVPLQLAAAFHHNHNQHQHAVVAAQDALAARAPHKTLTILPRQSRAGSAHFACTPSTATNTTATNTHSLAGSRPSRPAKLKATELVEQLAHADAKGESSPSSASASESDEQHSPKPRHHSHSHTALAGRKRKAESASAAASDDDFDSTAATTPDNASDLSDADAVSVATEASTDVAFAVVATEAPPRKRNKKTKTAAYVPRATTATLEAEADPTATTAVVPAGAGLTAAFIRAQLIAQVKALQQRINAGVATDPRTELEHLRTVLNRSGFQFASCSGTMAIYGLSFPHAASAIPAPKVANVANAAPSAPAVSVPSMAHAHHQPRGGALAMLPPLDASLMPYPTFAAPTASVAVPFAAGAPAVVGAAESNTAAELDLHTFELLRVTHGSQMVFVNVAVAPNETIRFSLKVNKHLISRAPTSAYFEGRGFVVPSLVPHSSAQVRVSQWHRGTAQPLLCVVGGEVRHARLKSPAELAKLAAKQAAAAAAGHPAGAGDDDHDLGDDGGDADEKGVSRQHKKSVAAAKKDKDSNNGRPLKCNLICQAGMPIRFAVYCRRGFVPAMWASTKLRKLSDSRLIATNDDFKFKLLSSPSPSQQSHS